MSLPNVSSDIVWEVVRNQNAFLVKRNDCGGLQFSKDPLNLTNLHSRKHAGFVNSKAVGLAPTEKGVKITTLKADSLNKPAKALLTVEFNANKTGRKLYKAVANQTAARGYRADLRQAAVARASAIRKSQRPVKESPEKKLRGKKAIAAAAEKQ